MKILDYQQQAIDHLYANERTALLLPPGCGKTVVTLTALCRQQQWPALVVAPAQVVEANVWGREAERWQHLEHLVVTPILGTAKKRLDLIEQEESNIDVISYENLTWLTDVIDISKYYRALVFDELSKMKTPGAKRFRRMRAKSWGIPIRYGLTGTPVGNHLLDLWGEMFMVAGAKPLGPTFTGYKNAFFAPTDVNNRVWKLKCCPKCVDGSIFQRQCKADWLHCECHRAAVKTISTQVKPYTFTLPTEVTSQGIPPVHIAARVVPEPAAVAKLTKALMATFVAELPSGSTLEAIGASAVASKLRQIAGGNVYNQTEDGVTTEFVHGEKLRALKDVLDEQQGAPVLIFYWYQHEKDRIAALLKETGVRFSTLGEERGMERWNAGKLDALLVHPQAAGFGLNLQDGGSAMVWYSLPHSHEMFTQGCGRLARRGQKAPFVTAIPLLCGPMDEYIARRLWVKREVEDMVLREVQCA